MTRLRWLLGAGLFSAGAVAARQDALFTSAVTYCAPPENVLVQELDIRYYQHNTSVVFDVTASSLVNDLRVALALNLTVYGNQPLSLDLNLCDLASAICPLPLYNFSGQGTLPIPSSFSSKIPSIGYTVPDLEAFAQLELRRVDTGEVAACVSATLSNGWSMRQPGATWAAVGVVLLSIVTSVLWAGSKARWAGLEAGIWAEKELWRVVDVITFVQMIGVSALLNLNYPSAYRAFSLNFPFALLLTGPIPSQSAIDHLREKTGGRLGDDALPTDEYVNRRLSPYNMQGFVAGAATLEPVVQNVDLGQNFGYSINSLNSTSTPLLAEPLTKRIAAPLAKRVFINPATVTASDALAGGVPVYVNGAGVATANAFLGLFFEWLVILAIALGVFLAFMLWRKTKRTRITEKIQPVGMSRTSRMIHGMILRLGLVLILPVSIFTMYQWTLRDSWLATLLSVICILVTWAGLAAVWVRLAFASRSLDAESTSRMAALRPSLAMIALHIVPVFIISLFVAFAGRSGITQVIAILVVEILSLGVAGYLRWKGNRRERDAKLNVDPDSESPAISTLPTPLIPPPTKTSITLRVLRIVPMGLMIPFVESIGVKPIPRTVIGIVTAGVWGIGVVLAFLVLLWGVVKLIRRKRVSGTVGTGMSTDSEENVKSPTARGNKGQVSPTPRTESDRSLYYDARTGVTPTPGQPLSPGRDYFEPHAR